MSASDANAVPEPSSIRPTRTTRRKRRSFVRRHKALTVLAFLLLILISAVLAIGLFLSSKLGQIDRVPIVLAPADRPVPTAGKSLNILLAGVDNGTGPSVAEAIESHSWVPGTHRSDMMAILHVNADRTQAYLVSIPRDSYVPIYDNDGERAGKNKVNAAFSLYQPAGMVSTVEHLTGSRIDHVAIIDWDGFEALTNALGGVEVFVSQDTVDPTTGLVTATRGAHNMDGAEALAYVRERYGLPGGDFDRIARQQNFMRAMMTKMTTSGTLTDPGKLLDALDAATNNITVDDQWSNGDIRNLILSLRGLRPADFDFLTGPTAPQRNRTIEDVGEVVGVDRRDYIKLGQALNDDAMAEYATRHAATELSPGRQVR